MSIAALADLLRGRRFAVLTGAGISTASGIPDYRGPGTLARARNPIQFRDFVNSDATRRRYWARATVGWERVVQAQPNMAHRALAALEAQRALTGIITQNVDRLHQRAGSEAVVELHGALAEVTCLACKSLMQRTSLQRLLIQHNPGWDGVQAPMAPDGDAELDADTANFWIPSCACGGILKPHVVFFGENVPRPRVDQAFEWLDSAEGLLVVGSSLAVFSGYRFVRKAAAIGMPIGLINLGTSRGEQHANVSVQAPAEEALPELVSALGMSARPRPALRGAQRPR